MTETYNVYDAKTHFSELLARTAKGEEFVIAKAGKPIGRLVPFDHSLEQRTMKTGSGTKIVRRQLGLAKSKIWAAPDAFSEETDTAIADMIVAAALKND